MNIKLHNKYEITLGEKTYIAYNTITEPIFDAINNFTQYGTFLAVGNGSVELGYNNPYMSNHLVSFPTEVEEVQCDPSKGDMYVKRTIHISQPGNIFNITELGLTNEDSSHFNPVVYSHAYIKDESGNIKAIYKSSDLDLFVRVTVYLEVDAQSITYLTAGENKLVKAILGVLDTAPQVTVARGYNNTPNDTFVHRNIPRDAKTIATSVQRISENNTEKIEYSFDARSGETAELVLLFDGQPVARINTIGRGTKTNLTMENAVSQDNYTLDIGANIEEINWVQTTAAEDVSTYKLRKYAKEFTDFIANPFDVNFTHECARWLSYDGNKIAFVADGTLYLYLNENYALHKIVHNISSTNLSKIIMFENFIFAVYSVSPYFAVYTFDNSLVASQISTDMQVYQAFNSSYDWQEMQVISNDNTNFVIGIVLGAIARRPVLIRATLADNKFTITNAEFGKSDYIVHSFALYKNNFCNSMIGFITNNYNGTAESYRIEQWYTDYTYEITNEIPAYYLCNSTASLEGKSRAVIAKKTESPYIWMYYYPQVYRYSISLTSGVQNWISTDLMYIIQKYNDTQTPYKIYSLNDYNNPQEFIDGFPSSIDMSTVTDFEFLSDTLLIFTTSDTYALNLKVNQTVLENMPSANTEYNVSVVQEQLIGTSKTEGVMGSFSLVFNV